MVYAANLKNPAIRHLFLSYLTFSFLVTSLQKSVSKHGVRNYHQVLMVCVILVLSKEGHGLQCELTGRGRQEFE